MKKSQLRQFVIVGGGLAGAEAATTLRSEGFDGRIVLVADEGHSPYDRPPLSKDYLRGESGLEKVLLHEAAEYERLKIELVHARANRILPGEHVVVLDGGTRLPFDRLLLATGAARPRTLPGVVAGERVHVLRTLDDADRLRDAVSSASSALVAGGGWIAAETAASLRQLGLEVTLIVPGGTVLERSLGSEVGAIYTALHRNHGVSVVERTRVASVTERGTGAAVGLDDGGHLRGDLVVLGFGAVPNLELASEAGLRVADGIIVDERLETSVPGIFAAGDVAAAWRPRYRSRLRVEHWDNARKQGPVAARNMLGRGEAFDELSYFYSDQYELGMESWGRPDLADDMAVRHFPDGAFVAVWTKDGRAVAATHGNVWDAAGPLEHLVASSAAVDVSRLRRVPESLNDLVTEAA